MKCCESSKGTARVESGAKVPHSVCSACRCWSRSFVLLRKIRHGWLPWSVWSTILKRQRRGESFSHRSSYHCGRPLDRLYPSALINSRRKAMPKSDRIDVDAILSKLKDFQRRSVDFVFNRMYGADPTRRFLLADEVGLGKTLVARGVIAKAIEHLRTQSQDRIDVVYICSNGDIARQNISRLNVTGQPDFQLATRITLLPQTVRDMKANALNFISFTPNTSFSLGHSTGRGEERALLYWLLKWTWPELCEGTGAMNVMQVDMTKDN